MTGNLLVVLKEVSTERPDGNAGEEARPAVRLPFRHRPSVRGEATVPAHTNVSTAVQQPAIDYPFSLPVSDPDPAQVTKLAQAGFDPKNARHYALVQKFLGEALAGSNNKDLLAIVNSITPQPFSALPDEFAHAARYGDGRAAQINGRTYLATDEEGGRDFFPDAVSLTREAIHVQLKHDPRTLQSASDLFAREAATFGESARVTTALRQYLGSAFAGNCDLPKWDTVIRFCEEKEKFLAAQNEFQRSIWDIAQSIGAKFGSDVKAPADLRLITQAALTAIKDNDPLKAALQVKTSSPALLAKLSGYDVFGKIAIVDTIQDVTQLEAQATALLTARGTLIA